MKKGQGYLNLGRSKLKKTTSPCYNRAGGERSGKYKNEIARTSA